MEWSMNMLTCLWKWSHAEWSQNSKKIIWLRSPTKSLSTTPSLSLDSNNKKRKINISAVQVWKSFKKKLLSRFHSKIDVSKTKYKLIYLRQCNVLCTLASYRICPELFHDIYSSVTEYDEQHTLIIIKTFHTLALKIIKNNTHTYKHTYLL